MNYNYIIGLIIIGFVLWLVSHLRERRRFFNGFFFLLSLGFLWLAGLIYSIDRDVAWIRVLVSLSLLIFIFLGIIAYIAFVITLFTSGRTLIKKEGKSFSHILSILLGLGIIISSFGLPFIMGMEGHRMLKSLVSFGFSYFTYFLIGFYIFTASALVYRLHFTKKDKDFLIVLGAGLMEDRVTPLLASRVDRAIDFYGKQIEKTGKRPMIIMSGGQGPDELVAEAVAMKDYAVSRGVKEEDIVCEDRSTSTEENIKFSSHIVDDYGLENPRVLFFTSNYHVFRAALIARDQGLDYNGLGAGTKFYFLVSAFIREYVGVLYLNLSKNLLFSSLFATFVAINTYFN